MSGVLLECGHTQAWADRVVGVPCPACAAAAGPHPEAAKVLSMADFRAARAVAGVTTVYVAQVGPRAVGVASTEGATPRLPVPHVVILKLVDQGLAQVMSPDTADQVALSLIRAAAFARAAVEDDEAPEDE